jgi:hypothetical protein
MAQIDELVAELAKVHAATHQYYALATSLQQALNLPFLPTSASMAITGLDAANRALRLAEQIRQANGN